MSASTVLVALECTHGSCPCHMSGRRGRGLTHCPVPGHGRGLGDRLPSLSVDEKNGTTLVSCKATCEQAAVLAVLREHGLWGEQASPQAARPPTATTKTRWQIKDASGQVVAVHGRQDYSDGTKRMWWEHPDGRRSSDSDPLPVKPADMLYGLELLAQRPGEPVVLTEGEKAADALRALGVLALGTVCGAASTPSEEVLRHLVAHAVTLWPDAVDGLDHMARTAARLVELGAVGLRMVEPPAGVKVGWDAADATADQAKALLEAAKRWEPSAASTASTRITGWPTPLDEEAFHGLAGEVVRAIDPHTEADPAAILMQFLVGFGSLVGRHPYVVLEADRHYTNLFVVLVGETAKARKGTSWGRVRHLVAQVDQEWANTRIMGGLSSGEGLIHEVRDRVEKQGKVVDEGVDDKRLLIVEPEFSNVLKQANNPKNILSGVLRQAWESGDLRNLVVQQPRRATGAHVSVIGHITRDELLRQISETDAANGFGNRFLWVCVKRSKELPRGGGLVDFTGLLGRLRSSVGFARRCDDELKPDEEAWVDWESFYGPLSAGKPGLLGAMIARGEPLVMRLAKLYALLDQSSVIRVEHVRAGLAVWQYCEDSARYIFGERLGDPTADAILAALRARPAGMTRTEVSVNVFSRNKSAEEISRALNRLLSQGLVAVTTVETAGRSAEIWRAT